MNVLDLFSGIGGFSLGLERAGMRTVAFCEIDPYCQRVLRKHWPNVPVFGDVRELTAEALSNTHGIRCEGHNRISPSQAGELCDEPCCDIGAISPVARGIDVICGGFPCQDISFAGKGAGIGGSRSGLWSEYARIIGEVRPRYVVVENVAALLGRGVERVLGDLAALGFDAEWHCIPASAVGAPHRRDRVWIVGYANAGRELQSEGSEPHIGRWSGDSSWWRVEPDVGRVADGVPAELDGSRNGKEKHSAEASTEGNSGNDGMSGMRGNGTIGTAPSRLFPAGFGASLMSELSRQGRPTGWDATQEGDAALRTLREGVHADAQQETQSVQSGMPRHRWPHECGEALGEIWTTEPDIGRVTHGVQNRVDRLRALGNAIVPQIAEIIGRAIMSAEREQYDGQDDMAQSPAMICGSAGQ